ncbi:MAG: NADH-quinone oxidoreductase subunit C [Candidatus Dadabacteria bacterium]|nr:NADH-quinone oxidoreductase subunit C [Candidatus Dadabacteria bacterium]NIQ16185.1 NADH-quinone oxidoreductase subunit C [Candidatus Dadabacteria bacterium]
MSDPGLISSIKNLISSYAISEKEFRGETTFTVKKDSILELCNKLKLDFNFQYLADLTVVDYLEIKFPRYEVVYLLHRFGDNHDENLRIRLKVPIESDDCSIDSVTSVWIGANWLEREAFDMFGITFVGHPDPRRILMPDDYPEYPLRKDFDVRNREPSKKSFEKALDEGIE